MAARCVLDADALLAAFTNPHIANVPDVTPTGARAYAPYLAAGFPKYGIDNRREAAHWLAQVGYETGCLNWLEEWDGAEQARRFGYGGGPRFYGRGSAMTTHDYNYETTAEIMRRANVATRPDLVGCLGDDPTAWPRHPEICLESGMAFWVSRGFDEEARMGDDGFDPIMQAWLGASRGHPSYWDRWALYRAMINKLPRPLFEEV